MKLRPCFWAGCSVAIGLVIATLVLVGIGVKYVAPRVWDDESAESWIDSLWAESTEEEEHNGYDLVPMGDPLACGGREVTVCNVRREAFLDGRTAGAGNVFIVVSLSIRKVGSLSTGYDTSEFMLSGNKDSVQSLAYEPDTGSLLRSGSLLTAGSVKGDVVRRVAADGVDPVLIWHDGSRLCGYFSLQ